MRGRLNIQAPHSNGQNRWNSASNVVITQIPGFKKIINILSFHIKMSK